MSNVCGLIDSKAITDINELAFNILLILRSLTPTCPEDRSPIGKHDLKPPSDELINLINNLKVKCYYSTNGCQAVVPLNQLKTHTKRCQFNPKFSLSKWFKSHLLCYDQSTNVQNHQINQINQINRDLIVVRNYSSSNSNFMMTPRYYYSYSYYLITYR